MNAIQYDQYRDQYGVFSYNGTRFGMPQCYEHWTHFQEDSQKWRRWHIVMRQGKATWPLGKLKTYDHSFIVEVACYTRRNWSNWNQKNSLNWICTYLLSLTLIEANCRIPKSYLSKVLGKTWEGGYIAFESWEIRITPYYFFLLLLN